MGHTELCIQSAMQSAAQNMNSATDAELRAEALNYLECGISDCTCR
jgi:hypothetical protein